MKIKTLVEFPNSPIGNIINVEDEDIFLVWNPEDETFNHMHGMRVKDAIKKGIVEIV